MNENLIVQFVTTLRIQRYADRSVKTYSSHLTYFLRISAKHKPEDITKQQIENFIIWLVEKKSRAVISEGDDFYNYQVL